MLGRTQSATPRFFIFSSLVDCTHFNPVIARTCSCVTFATGPYRRRLQVVEPNDRTGVKGGEKVYHCGGGIVYHRHDEKGLNWEPGGIRSGAGVRSSGVSQESTGSSDTWEAALCRLCLRR